MHGRMRAAIKNKLQEMKEAFSDDEWDDDELPHMGRRDRVRTCDGLRVRVPGLSLE